MFDTLHDRALGGSAGTELIGNDSLRGTALFSQKAGQQSPRGLRVAMDSYDFVEDVTFLIDGAPEVALFPVNRDDDLVRMPDIASAWRLMFETTGVIRAEFQRPSSYRLV